MPPSSDESNLNIEDICAARVLQGGGVCFFGNCAGDCDHVAAEQLGVLPQILQLKRQTSELYLTPAASLSNLPDSAVAAAAQGVSSATLQV